MKSIKTRYLLILFIVILIPMVLSGIVNFQLNKKTLVRLNLENQKKTLQSFRDMVVFRHMDDMERTILSMSEYEGLTTVTTDPEAAREITQLWDQVRFFFPERAWIYYGDWDNRIIVSPEWIPDESYDLRKRPWFINALKQDGVVWSPPFVEYVTSDIVLTASMAIRNEQGEIQGVLAIDTFLKDFLSLFQSGIDDYEDNILLLDKDRKVLISNRSDFLSLDLSAERESFPRNPVLLNFAGENYYVTEIPIPSLEWTLISLLPEKHIQAETANLRILLFTLLLASSILAVLTATLLSSYIIRNITSLNRHMARITGGDYTSRICVNSRDEFLTMNNQLNTMTERLSQSILTVKSLMQLLSHSVSNSLVRLDSQLQKLLSDEEISPEGRDILLDAGRELATLQLFILNTALMKAENLEDFFYQKEQTCSGELIQLIKKRLARRAKARGISLISFHPSPGLLISGNQFLLLLVLENIVDNAIKFSPPNSDVEIRCKPVRENLVIQIADHGPGFPEEKKQSLFKRGDADPSQDVSHGVGLWVSKKILRFLGGNIHLLEKQGYGSVFSIILPISDGNEIKDSGSAKPPKPQFANTP